MIYNDLHTLHTIVLNSPFFLFSWFSANTNVPETSDGSTSVRNYLFKELFYQHCMYTVIKKLTRTLKSC